jgi:hypothetical protein
VFREVSAGNKFILAVTTIAFFLIMTMPNYSVLAYTEHVGGDKSLSDTMSFRVLKGDLNVCSPNYLYNITICQMVMQDEELLPFGGEGTNSTHTNKATNTANSTSSNGYPPYSIRPELVINEEQLQELMANSSLNTSEGEGESLEQNATGTTRSSDTEGESDGKIYVDEYPQFEPLGIEQPLEEEIIIDNSSQSPRETNQQTPFLDNQTLSNGVHDIEDDSSQSPRESNQQTPFLDNHTLSNGVHDIEEPWLSKDAIPQVDKHRDSITTNGGSSLGDTTDNSKADTSNSYSSLPMGM